MSSEGITDDFPRLPARRADSHKGDYGRALLVGGSRGMAGAIALAGMAALRSGAGLVRLATADVCLETVASFEPSYMTAPLPADEHGRISQEARDAIAELAVTASCLACGPGIGRSDSLNELIGWMYQSLKVPVVFDADALNALAECEVDLADAAGPRILTPHPGEFRRLIGSADLPAAELPARAVELARDNRIVVVLKGHGTLITDGHRQCENTSGNPGMATGGTGDVLTGVITALVCQGLAPLDAAQLGVYLHGLAGDFAVDEVGEVSLIASDLIEYLPDAFEQVAE